MKKTRIAILKTYNGILGVLLAILGYAASCQTVDEYGTPTAKFIVKGKVTSKQSNQPVPNIRVVMQCDTSLLNDTTFTGSDGTYQVTDKWGFPEDQTYLVQFQDMDSIENNSFNNFDTLVEFKDPQFKGGDGDWYKGETSKEVNIKLTPKE